MISLSRRRFLQGAQRHAARLPGFPATRSRRARRSCVTTSPRRKAPDMLTIYANAMRTMLARPETDPISWLWQWYTHFVSGATTKAAEHSTHLRHDRHAAEHARQRDVEYLPVACRAEHQPLPAVAPHVRVLLRIDHPGSQRPAGLHPPLLGLHLGRSAQARHPAAAVPTAARPGVQRAVSLQSHRSSPTPASASTRRSRPTRWTSARRWPCAAYRRSAPCRASAARSTPASTGDPRARGHRHDMGAVPYAGANRCSGCTTPDRSHVGELECERRRRESGDPTWAQQGVHFRRPHRASASRAR